MTNSTHTARIARRALIAATALLALFALQATRGESTPPTILEPFVTAATRTPALPQTIGSAVDVISADDLAKSQISSFAQALGASAGVPLFPSGAPGSATSLFLRGANSDQTLFLVDGIRLNDPNTDYQVFLGGGSVGARDRIQIARGPQSTLYGADAIGGVIAINAERGSGRATSRAELEAGSFDTVNATLACQGEAGADAWNFTARGGHTKNSRPNNGFNSANVALRLDHQLSDRIDAGGTLRWFLCELDSPGDKFTNDPNDHEAESNLLATAFLDAKLGSEWKAHAILGGQDRRYVNDMPAPNQYGSPSETDVVSNRRGIFDGQTTYTGIDRHRLTGGVTTEVNTTRNTGFGSIDKKQAIWAVFAQDEFSASDRLFFTAGGRHDDFGSFGGATTGRVTAAWLAVPQTVKLRASYGTGFRAPSFLELFGHAAPYYVGNPHLDPERSRGFDAGVDYYVPIHRATLSATWFDTEFTDLIEYAFKPYPQPSTVENVGRARTRGVELSAHIRLPADVDATASYTYLDAQSLLPNGHSRLLRRPQHQADLDAHRDFARGISVGAGVHYTGRRDDVDALTFGSTVDPDYTVVRAYAAWQASPRLTIKARIENALNRKYEPVNGYPALGIGAFGAAEWTF